MNSGFSSDAQNALLAYHWPGNVRQLEHEIERAVIMADDGELIGKDALSDTIVTDRPAPEASIATLPTGKLRDVMGLLEERVIRRSLNQHGNNRTRAAEALGISRQALQAKLAKWRDEASSSTD